MLKPKKGFATQSNTAKSKYNLAVVNKCILNAL
jgi:hypothetical protein